MREVPTGLDAEPFRLYFLYFAANLHVVGHRGHRGIEVEGTFLVCSAVSHTKTEVEFARREERRLHVVCVGGVVVENLCFELERKGIVPFLDGLNTEHRVDLEHVLVDGVATERVLRS